MIILSPFAQQKDFFISKVLKMLGKICKQLGIPVIGSN